MTKFDNFTSQNFTNRVGIFVMDNFWTSSNNTEVHVALDLGSDTLKVAYAFKIGTHEYTGKIVRSNDTMTALPAVAYYDSEKGKWYFCEEVSKQQGKSFLTVVKIKSLISMLQSLGDDDKSTKQCATNTKYYNSEHHFPKFYFPLDKREVADFDRLVRDFDQLVAKDRSFVAEGYTPRSVCELYFKHVAGIVHERLTKLMKQFGCGYSLQLSIVYPPHIGREYIDELKRLALNGFDNKYPVKVALSMTKALSIYASEQQLLASGQSALIFNIGEEKTFVAKTYLYGKGAGKGISIDGVEGHNPPIELGGNDIDRAVAAHLEQTMYDRETMGTPSVGNQ